MFDQKTLNNFWDKVRKRKSGCWEWIGGKDIDGYGMFGFEGKTHKAHRISFALNMGIMPNDENFILHLCHNTSCVNPAHLYDGTQIDNMQDAIKRGTHTKGTFNKGENHGNAKLTENDVRKIRQLNLHFTVTQISKLPEFKDKINRIGIYHIVNYRTWKHIK